VPKRSLLPLFINTTPNASDSSPEAISNILEQFSSERFSADHETAIFDFE
jgi:hypothetical protein